MQITGKQRAARQRNIKVAQNARKKAGPAARAASAGRKMSGTEMNQAINIMQHGSYKLLGKEQMPSRYKTKSGKSISKSPETAKKYAKLGKAIDRGTARLMKRYKKQGYNRLRYGGHTT
jgi:hypothetical protein